MLAEAYPWKVVDYTNRLLPISYGLLWGKVACCFGLLGFPGLGFIFIRVSPGMGLAYTYLDWNSTNGTRFAETHDLKLPCHNFDYFGV